MTPQGHENLAAMAKGTNPGGLNRSQLSILFIIKNKQTQTRGEDASMRDPSTYGNFFIDFFYKAEGRGIES